VRTMKACAVLFLLSCVIAVRESRGLDLLASLGTTESDDITAVAARASNDYVRARLANGSFAPESYVFGNGGLWPDGTRDASIDKLTFLDVAHTIAFPLEGRNYLPSKDPKTTRLLIMVYWGGTQSQDQPNQSAAYASLQDAIDSMNRARMLGDSVQMRGGSLLQAQGQMDVALSLVTAANRARDDADFRTAKLLGYDSWWDDSAPGYFVNPARERRFEDLLYELEDGRYFVVLMAYDFQLMWKQKKHKLLWETRFSIRQRHHEFDRDLPVMAQFASQYFGQDSHGLVHEKIPLGRVDVGEPKSLGEVGAPSK